MRIFAVMLVLTGLSGCWYDTETYDSRFEALADSDDDGYDATSPADCDDHEPGIHPNSEETPGDGIDQNCDGFDDCYIDGDFDGYGNDDIITGTSLDCSDRVGISKTNDDCNDGDPDINPGQLDVLDDGINQDCDNSTGP